MGQINVSKMGNKYCDWKVVGLVKMDLFVALLEGIYWVFLG